MDFLKYFQLGMKIYGGYGIINRLDAFTENPFALKLYDNLGYSRVGYADWRKGRFYLMEKYL